MLATQYFGYLLIAFSAVLLAQHWQQYRDMRRRPPQRREAYRQRQLQRRSVASALIGVVGAAMTLVDRVPRTPLSMTAYLFALLMGGSVILAIALADMRAARRHRESAQWTLLARELHKLTETRAKPTPADAADHGSAVGGVSDVDAT